MSNTAQAAMKTATINGVKLMKKGVKGADGTYSPVRYSIGARYEKGSQGKATYNAAAIYAKGYAPLPAALFPQNESDAMTDYFEKDKVVFREGTPEFEIIAALAAA